MSTTTKGTKKSKAVTADNYGDQLAFCEPNWMQGFPTPYYNKSHEELRNKIRTFVENEIKPYYEDWIKSGKGLLSRVDKKRKKSINFYIKFKATQKNCTLRHTKLVSEDYFFLLNTGERSQKILIHFMKLFFGMS